MHNCILLLILLKGCKSSANELTNIENQINEANARIFLIEQELGDYNKTKSVIVNQIRDIKKKLDEEEGKVDLGSQNLEQTQRFKDEMNVLLNKQTDINKKIEAKKKKIQTQNEERKKLDLKLTKCKNRSKRRKSLTIYVPKVNSKSFDDKNTENIQNENKHSSHQYPPNTRQHHRKCFSPCEKNELNHSVNDLSRQALKDNNINQNRSPIKRPFNKNRRKTISSIDFTTGSSPKKPSSIENRLKPQKNILNSNNKSKPNFNINSEPKQPININSKPVKPSPTRSCSSNTSTPQKRNMSANQLTQKKHIIPRNCVLLHTNSTALKISNGLIHKTDNIQFENESNENANKFEENNGNQEVHVPKESISPLVPELPDKVILLSCDDHIESVRGSTQGETYNLIELTSQENVGESGTSIISKNGDENKNADEQETVDILAVINKSQKITGFEDLKKQEIPVSLQIKTLRNKRLSPLSQTLKMNIIQDFQVFDKTLMVDDLKDILPTTIGINNEKENKNKERDFMVIPHQTNHEPLIEADISDNNKKLNDIDDFRTTSLSRYEPKPKRAIRALNNDSFSEPSNIIELKNISIFDLKPLEFNTDLKNEKFDDDIGPSDSDKEKNSWPFNRRFKIFCIIITCSVLGIVVISVVIYKQNLFSLFFFN